MRKFNRNRMLVLCCCGLVASQPQLTAMAQAYDLEYEEPDSTERTDITVNISHPEDYSGTLEFYCGGETFYLSVQSGTTETSVPVSVTKGKSEVGFLDADDVIHAYQLSYEKTLDTEHQNSIDVKIDYAEDTLSVSDGEIDAPEDPGTGHDPAVYDFSDGTENGILQIACTPYASFDSVIYTLTGAKHIYEIVLDAEHNFSANVRIPTGSYGESSSIQVTPNAIASIADGMSFSWGHRNSEGYFGKNYTVRNNETTVIGDLYIRMNYQGDLREVDDSILMAPGIMTAYSDLKEERRKEFKENELHESSSAETAPAETIATAEPVEPDKTQEWIKTAMRIGAAILIGAGSGIFILKRKRRKHD